MKHVANAKELPPTRKPGDGERSNRRAEKLMPFGAAAKEIFVKANGLVAYQDATGTGRRSADEQPPRGVDG